ncbi:MAG TPA: MBL fold metallo-hydrolase [Burkholderiaceae bacterium]|nr:MBL fold metallo-hydrolase [Burkholderiaceae bacterium]
MSPRAGKWSIAAVLLLALLGAASFAVLSLPPFGAKASGARLERMRANPQFENGQFVNVERQAAYTWADVRLLLDGQFLGNELREPPAPIPVVAVDPRRLAETPNPGLRAFWIGHASVYVEVDGVRVLIDPVFSDYASPFALGPKRFHPPPIALAELPRIDAVVISHDHYDHLDMATVRQLAARGTVFFVPLGVGAHLERWEVPMAQIRELEWWQEGVVGGVRFVCTPTRHYSGRGLTDSRATLWSSWSVIGPQHRFFYSGDTGYSKHFAEIGARLGPFDLSFIKVGAYGPGQPWIDIHMPPEDAVRAHVEVGGKRLFPVHWGTFNLAFHAWDEPIRRTVKAAAERGIDLATPRIGQMVDAERPFLADPWWESVR